MSIITISRGSYSRGKEVAERLAQKLNYECISRDILLEASEEFNIPEIKLVSAIHDAPSVLDRFRHGKERYISYIRKALLQRVQKDNVIYHGLAGHYFLLNIPHVFKVRIIADMEERVKEEVKREKISSEKARYHLQKDDDERRKWGLQLYGIDTWDSRLYDMVIHIKTITVEDATEIIAQTVRKPFFQSTPESIKILDNLLLAATVKTALTDIAPLLNVTADDGVVSIGNSDSPSPLTQNAVKEIKRIAGNVDGVSEVILWSHEKKDTHHSVNPFHNI
ncbi:histidine kinase [Desulfonema ishimotonii]|uniref:Histidine kinase n=1 Tax=Desulfonema ishimotonii TaxID=45657 RepID=A0A401FS62_9BACT|nr:cytidylate kinase-like family protein [Desulfonema ishimotonii]GBC59807.1 histidine kinase [Desulfonema ishimotonii]